MILAKHFQYDVSEMGEIQQRYSERSFIAAPFLFRLPVSVDVKSLTRRKDDQWFGDQSKI